MTTSDSRVRGVLVLAGMLATIAWCTVVDVACRIGGRR